MKRGRKNNHGAVPLLEAGRKLATLVELASPHLSRDEVDRALVAWTVAVHDARRQSPLDLTRAVTIDDAEAAYSGPGGASALGGGPMTPTTAVEVPSALVLRSVALVPLIRSSRYPDTSAITDDLAAALALEVGLDALEAHLQSQPRIHR